MNSKGVFEVLNRLDTVGLEWWLDGGWGVDALLGEQTRSHDDLDFAIRLADAERLPAVFPEFRRVHRDWGPGAFVLRDSDGRQLDFHLLEFDSRGDGWQPAPKGEPFRWPAEALSAHGRIAGRRVRCTSPEFQVESHLYTGYDDVDWDDVRVLCERFGLELPPAHARPPGFVHPRRALGRPR
jgi:lincosamide nucleotidyltransferase A/C/D/E